jgi:surface protein
MFAGCSSLTILLDILKWNMNNVTNIDYIFAGCLSLPVIPEILQRNKNYNEENIFNMFNGCISLLNII